MPIDMNGSPSVTVVIPWRDKGCLHRQNNLREVRSHLAATGWPITLSDSNAREPWNLSAARNAGVAQSSTDIVIIHDGDMMIPIDALQEAVTRADSTGRVVHPYDRVEYLDVSSAVTRSLPLTPGGCTVLRRDLFISLGGYDEEYKGWGYEDRDFDRTCAVQGVDWLAYPASHLWHPSSKNTQSAEFIRNKLRYESKQTAHVPLDNDIVYRVRRGTDNDELRYSLRSLCNIPHRNVWFVGNTPGWATNVKCITGDRYNNKWENSFDGIVRACQHAEISESFVLMDDDMIFLRPSAQVNTWHYYTLAKHYDQACRNTHGPGWLTSLRNTITYLHAKGVTNPVSYEIHVPFIVQKSMALPILEDAFTGWSSVPPQPRSVIANLTGAHGEWRADVKTRDGGRVNWDTDLLSTSDGLFHTVRRELHALFPDPSPYEKLMLTATVKTIKASDSWKQFLR